MDLAGRSARVDPERTRRQLQEAGFVDIREDIIRCCLNPWSDDPIENEASFWFNSSITKGLQAMALVPMIDHGDLNKQQVDTLCQRVHDEMCTLRYYMYMNLLVKILPFALLSSLLFKSLTWGYYQVCVDSKKAGIMELASVAPSSASHTPEAESEVV